MNQVKKISLNPSSSVVVDNSELTFYELAESLNKFKSQLTVDNDLQNIIDSLNSAVDQAQHKQKELELLAFFSFFSNHPMVVEQRNQLFLSTKMIYDQMIGEIIKEYKNNRHYTTESNEVPTTSDLIENKNSIYEIYDHFRAWVKNITRARKRFKLNEKGESKNV